MASHPDLALALLLTIIAVVPRLAFQLQAPIFVDEDSAGYVEPAYDLATGQGATNRVKRPLGYPLLLAATFAAFGPNLMMVALVQHGLGVVTVVLTYLLGRTCFNRGVGFGAGLLVAISGPQLTYEHTLLTESLSALLLVALALVLIKAVRADGRRPAVLAGVILGAATLVKPVGQSLLPVALLFATLRTGRHLERLASAAVLLAAFAVVVTPWMLRNLVVHGQLTIGGGLGQSLLAHTLKYSRGQFVFDSPDLPTEEDPVRGQARRMLQAGVESDTWPTEMRDRVSRTLDLNEVETDLLLQQLAMDAIRRQPMEFLGDIPEFLIKVHQVEEPSFSVLWASHRLWRTRDKLRPLLQPATAPQEASRWQSEALANLYQPSRYGLLPPALALVGLVAAWRVAEGRGLVPAIVPGILWLSLLLVHVTVNGWGEYRYRYVVEPFVNVLALGGLQIAFRQARVWLRTLPAEATVSRQAASMEARR